jgi:hypothetical protein
VRPEGLEPPAYWFEARNRRTFMSLALGTRVVQHCALLRVIKHFRAPSTPTLAKLRNASMQSVGTNWAQLIFARQPTKMRRRPAGAEVNRSTSILPELLVPESPPQVPTRDRSERSPRFSKILDPMADPIDL